jgi:signal peptidase II
MKHSLTFLRLVALLLCFGIIALDQWSKQLLLSLSNSGEFPIEIFNFFNIVLAWNSGISFGMFAHMQAWMPLILTIATSLVVLFLVVWLVRTRDLCTSAALSFIIGGAVGNIIDRVHYHAVIDFLDFHLGNYHWPAFNVADSAIFIGVVILVLISIVRPAKG